MTAEELQDRLKKEFNGCEIVKLEDITKKISIISKVRVSKVRDFTDYDEISLYNIDEYGTVYIPDDAKEQEPANFEAVRKQALEYGDVVINQRAAKMKVGFIGREYKRAIVGNNSMIRIQFNNDCIDTARFVQLYLQLPYVLEYLNEESNISVTNRAINKLNKYKFSKQPINLIFLNSQYELTAFFKKYKRKILSSAQLRELPIPKFTKQEQNIPLSEILYPRMELIAKAKQMRDDAQKLIEKYEAHKMELVDIKLLQNISPEKIDKDMEEIEVFDAAKRVYFGLLE